MNKSKKQVKKARFGRQARSILGLLFKQHRSVVLGTAMVLLLIAAAAMAWRKFGPQISSDPRYYLNEQMVEATPAPKWIHADVKAEVVRDEGLHELSLLDASLVGKVADAFALHPWVSGVTSVEKRPDRVVVELVYRRPVAMVRVKTNGREGLIPVDKNGILLPTDDFSIREIRNYLRVVIPDISAYADAGVAWEDERVVDAARLAAAWGKDWRQLNLYKIVAFERDDDPLRRRTAFFELHTKQGSKIIWGHAPGRERDGEADAKSKIAALIRYGKESGLDESSGERYHLDAQSGQVQTLPPQTADRSVPR